MDKQWPLPLYSHSMQNDMDRIYFEIAGMASVREIYKNSMAKWRTMAAVVGSMYRSRGTEDLGA